MLLSHGDAGGAGLVVPEASALRDVEARLHYTFRDRGLLEHALTHKSRAAEDPSGGVVDNESLEFLGDAVLGFIIADLLYREFPDYSEGPKSKAKASLVSTATLAGLSRRLGLGDDLLLGRGEAKTGGRAKPALLADVLEAVIAAIYLDGGIEAARTFIDRAWRPLIGDVRQTATLGGDHKSALQEWLQASGRPLRPIASRSKPGPTTRSASMWTRWWTAPCWRRVPARPRRKRSRKPRGWRSSRWLEAERDRGYLLISRPGDRVIDLMIW